MKAVTPAECYLTGPPNLGLFYSNGVSWIIMGWLVFGFIGALVGSELSKRNTVRNGLIGALIGCTFAVILVVVFAILIYSASWEDYRRCLAR